MIRSNKWLVPTLYILFLMLPIPMQLLSYRMD